MSVANIGPVQLAASKRYEAADVSIGKSFAGISWADMRGSGLPRVSPRFWMKAEHQAWVCVGRIMFRVSWKR
jgi:hypothetical protein